MKYLSNKYYKPFILLFSVTFLIEIIFKLVMHIGVLDWSLLRIIIGLMIINSIIAIILSYLNDKLSNKLIFSFSVFASIYALVQAGFNNYLGTYMSIATSSQAHAIGSFIFDFIQSFKPTYWLLLIPLALLKIYYVTIDVQVKNNTENANINYLDKIKSKKKQEEFLSLENSKSKKEQTKINIKSALIIFLLAICYYGTIVIPFMQNDLQMVSNLNLFKNPSMPNIVVSQYGIEGFGFIDLKSLILPTKESSLEMPSEEESTTEEDTNTELSRQIDDTMWKNVNENETNTDYQKLNNYFLSKKITTYNDNTGLLENKNLIVIMMESGSNVLTDYPEYFPNINKLYNEGWSWTNNFSPRNACSTGNNEMTGLTSLYTINRNCTANVYKDNTYYESMFNLFNNKGYYTSSYHDYTDHFYYRHVYHPNMGSQSFMGVDDLGITLGSGYQQWPSDVEFVQKSTPNYINHSKFMSWLTTVSSHMSYTDSSITGDMYLDLFKNESWDISAKRYMSKLKILDNAIGELLTELETSGKLDDTVLLLYADHYPYGLANSSFTQIAKYDVTSNADIDRTPFIIYNPELTPTKYNEYTSYLNILPTIANLFNLDYDPRLYGGTDLFSSDYSNIVVFADGSWRSPIAYYDATTGHINYLGTNTYTNEEIIKINSSISTEMSMDNLAIKDDYFTYLNNKLNKGFVVNSSSYKITEDVSDEISD
jgi:lipoteichoic acid synthase